MWECRKVEGWDVGFQPGNVRVSGFKIHTNQIFLTPKPENSKQLVSDVDIVIWDIYLEFVISDLSEFSALAAEQLRKFKSQE